MDILLTGITTTGTPHLGNYVGAILPALTACNKNSNNKHFYFLADYHALIKCRDPIIVNRSRLEVAATWLAMGLDVKKVVFYSQTDVPEILELAWIISCITPKGLMNRAHAYKAIISKNIVNYGIDEIDRGINMGLFCYPILMAADILLFRANKIPVGGDQIQHLEMVRDIAGYFNNLYGNYLVIPEAIVHPDNKVLTGTDGRKMSKSYNNIIPLFASNENLRKIIMSIKTNSLKPEEPKDTTNCILFNIYKSIASESEICAMRAKYVNGISWSEVKQNLFELLNKHLYEPRKMYEEFILQPHYIEKILKNGAERAREYSIPFIKELRSVVGIRPLL